MGGRNSKSEDSPGPPPKPEVGFDDFELLRAIGRGSFGKVSAAISRNGKCQRKNEKKTLFLNDLFNKNKQIGCYSHK